MVKITSVMCCVTTIKKILNIKKGKGEGLKVLENTTLFLLKSLS